MIPVPAVITDITATAADTVVEMAVAHMAVETAAGAIKIKSPVLETMANYGLLGFSLLNSGAKAATIFSARPPFSSEGSISLPSCHSFQLVMRIQSGLAATASSKRICRVSSPCRSVTGRGDGRPSLRSSKPGMIAALA